MTNTFFYPKCTLLIKNGRIDATETEKGLIDMIKHYLTLGVLILLVSAATAQQQQQHSIDCVNKLTDTYTLTQGENLSRELVEVLTVFI